MDAAGEAAAIRAFEDANGRRSTPAEQHLLCSLAERFDPAARERSRPGRDTGWAWVMAAIYEAVEAGSAFVAPRRLREILSRWEREGLPEADAGPASRASAPAAGRRRAAGGGGERSAPVLLGQAPDTPLPHGFGSVRTWAFTVGLLGAVLDHDRLTELLAGTAIAGYCDGEVTLAVPDAGQAERIMGEYRELIARKLSEAMRRPVRLAVLTGMPAMAERQADGEAAGARPSAVAPPEEQEDDPASPSFVVAECGLPSGQVWAAVLEEVVARGGVTRANFDAWLRTTSLIGRDERGGLVVGVPHALARRRVTGRFLAPLREAAASIIGADLPLEVVVAREWLRSGAGRGRLPAVDATRKGA
jgi:hypothetical protein